MGKEQSPDFPNVINLEQYREKIEAKKKKAAGIEESEPSKNMVGEKFNRRKYIESEINKIGREKWRKLEKFAKIEVLNPSGGDKNLAEDFKNMPDEELIIHFKITDENIWVGEPLAFKTLFEELERRRKGE